MKVIRYSQWDGSQDSEEIDPEKIMGAISETMLNYGDMNYALQKLFNYGIKGSMMGIQDIFNQLQKLRQQALDRHNLNSVMNEYMEKLDKIIERETGTIERQRDELRDRFEMLRTTDGVGEHELTKEKELVSTAEKISNEKLSFLEALPDNFSEKVKQLQDYKFVDGQAKKEFEELLNALKQQIMESYFKDIHNRMQSMTSEERQELSDMIKSLGKLLKERASGGTPDFQQFMNEYGKYFGDDPNLTLDELAESIQREVANMHSLLQSLPQDVLDSLGSFFDYSFLGEEFMKDMEELAKSLDQIFPLRDMVRKFHFRGGEPLNLADALKEVERLQKAEELERQLKNFRWDSDMEEIDSELIRELLGDEAYKSFETMKKLQDILEESGYIQRTSEGCKLTARGIKKIGEKALADIFAALKKEHFGRHQMQKIGQEGERTGGVRNYQYGDPFAIDLKETFLSALHRDARVPISISPTDFHVYEMESMSSASTVLLLDLSYSMIWSGSFLAAKKVAIALNNLIRTRYRKDVLYIVGFYAYAKEIKPDELPFISWDWWAPYTNIQEGLRISAKLLSNHKTSNKQIVLISDGEPTAHFENDGRLYFQYPPSPRTMSATLREVKRCTQKGITINTFMLDKNPYLIEFVNHMTRINKGRAFFTSPDDLGQYLMVDYLERKRKLIR